MAPDVVLTDPIPAFFAHHDRVVSVVVVFEFHRREANHPSLAPIAQNMQDWYEIVSRSCQFVFEILGVGAIFAASDDSAGNQILQTQR